MKQFAIVYENEKTADKVYFVCDEEETLLENKDLCKGYCVIDNYNVYAKIVHELDLLGIEIYTANNGESLSMSLEIIEHEIYRF